MNQPTINFDHIDRTKLSLSTLLCPYCSGALKQSGEAQALDILEALSELPFEASTDSLPFGHGITRLDVKLNASYKICTAHHTQPKPRRPRNSAASNSTDGTASTDTPA
jgi:hypothetical protein